MAADLVTIPISVELYAKLRRYPLPRLVLEKALDQMLRYERQKREKRDGMAQRRQARVLGWSW